MGDYNTRALLVHAIRSISDMQFPISRHTGEATTLYQWAGGMMHRRQCEIWHGTADRRSAIPRQFLPSLNG